MAYYSVLLIFGSVFLCMSHAQNCDSIATMSFYHARPSSFRGELTIDEHPLRDSDCFMSLIQLLCGPNVILGDGDTDMEPAQPNLNDPNNRLNEIGDFVIWHHSSQHPYVTIQRSSGSTITAIKLNFLNYPAENVSLPNIQVQSINAITDTSGDNVDFVLLDNEELSQDDYKRTSVTLRLAGLAPLTSNLVLLRWSFEGVYNLDWFFLSEVTFCTDTQPSYSPADTIQFLSPEANEVVQPSVQELTSGLLVLTCTVSIHGSFSWTWSQNDTEIDFDSNTKFQTFTADGTRTSKLFIPQLSFTDTATYTCTASNQRLTSNQMSREYELIFPTFVETQQQVDGYLGEQTVELTCEAHGFLTGTPSFSWFNESGQELLTNSNKFSINTRPGSKQVMFEDGTIGTSTISVLTINDLSEEDEGNYICRVEGQESTTILVVEEGTAPPTTSPPTNISETTNEGGGGGDDGSGSTDGNTGSSGVNVGAVVAGVIISLLVVALLVAIAVVIIVLLLQKRKDNIPFKVHRPSMKAITRTLSASFKRSDLRSSQNGTSNSVHMESQKKYTKADIEWQLSPKEKESDLQIYSVVTKPDKPDKPVKEEKRDEEVPPPVPPQNFNPNDISSPAMEVEQNHYADLADVVPADRRPHRRLTNSTAPKLAKLNGTKTGYGLEFNPIYASTNSVDNLGGVGNLVMVDATNTYAEPSYPTHDVTASSASKNVADPVYSEAITPAMLTQSQEGAPADNDLTPFGPIYAEPHPLNKSEEPIKITANNIAEIRQIGVGQFGEVVLAETVGLSLKDLKLSTTEDNKDIRVQVAVKKLRPDAQNPIREAFDKEIKFMSRLNNENIVKLLAVCTGGTPFIVMEYMENGDLHQFLSEHEPGLSESQLEPNQLPASFLLYMAIQIASGMRYLASLNYVHRDLATRNCLVGKNFIVKIADFGMSRSLYESSYYRVRGRAMLPIRWMATESFYGRFSEKSDVWSFGVVMWEIFTLGKKQPYEELDDQEMIKDAIRTVGRRRLDRPEFCPVEVYEVMVRCWEYAKDDRATFEEIFQSLAAIQQKS